MKPQELFWNAEAFVVITDSTKPAMRWAIDKLEEMGKQVYVVDISSGSEKLSQLPEGVEHAIIGVTTVEPADIMDKLEKKGVKKFWIHWRTETAEVKQRCERLKHCITGRCPVMYISTGFNIHTMHRAITKLTGKY